MIAEESINGSGYINTTIKTETPEETKILLRAMYKNPDSFGKIIKDGKPAKDCLLDCPVEVTTDYFEDVRIEDVLSMINDAKKDYQTLETIEIKGIKIREDIVIYIDDSDEPFKLGAGRIGIITTMKTDIERRLLRLLLNNNYFYKDYPWGKNYHYYLKKIEDHSDQRRNSQQHKGLEDLRLTEIEEIIRQAERDVDSLQKLTESWQLEKIATKTKETEMKITRKVRVA